MLQKMKYILVVGPKKDYQNIIDVLYRVGTVHLEDAAEGVRDDIVHGIHRMDDQTGFDLSSLLLKIGGIIHIMPSIAPDSARQAEIMEQVRSQSTNAIVRRANAIVGELEKKTQELATKKSDLDLLITSLKKYRDIIDRIQPIERQIPLLEGYEVTVLLLRPEFEEIIDLLRSGLSDITHGHFEMIANRVDEYTIAAITVFHKKYSEQVHAFLFSKNVNEVRIPKDYANMPLGDAMRLIDEKIRSAEGDMSAIDLELQTLSTAWYQELSVLQEVLEDRKEEFDNLKKFAQTDYTFIAKGWIPKKSLKATRDALKVAFDDRVVLAELPVTEEIMERAPSFYDNPRWVKPFEFFMNLVSPPKYGEIDPSPLLALFFPFFFGMIVGDIGYGLVIMVFALILRYQFRSTPWIQQVSIILFISSFPTIFFGWLYGEFFGNFGEEIGLLHPQTFLGITWNRIDALVPMLIFAIVIGVLHVFIGIIIGIINSINKKSRKHICENCGMLGVLIALLLIIAVVLEFLPSILLAPIIVLMVIALVLLIYGGGAMGPIHIMSNIGNILSYARLMAIGMASVILAIVANELGGAVGIVAVGVLIAVLLHALNIILAMFSPSIHSVRLHIVEFYSKFYEGGGIEYRPFRRHPREGTS